MSITSDAVALVLDERRARRDLEIEVNDLRTNQAVQGEQVAAMISAFRAARTAFYSLTVAMLAATILFLITGH